MSAMDRSLTGGQRGRRATLPRSPSRPEVSESAAIAAARGGDLRAWSDLIRRYQEIVYRSAYLVTRDSITAEDASKEAFTRAFRSLGSLDGDLPLRPWLLAISETVARRGLRELTRRRDAKMPERAPCPRLPATPVILGPGVQPPTPREHELLVETFDGLADDDRHVIAARYSFGLTRDEAALRFGLQPEAVEGRLAAGLGRLRARLADLLAVPSSIGREARPSGWEARPGGPPPPHPHRLISLGDDQLGALTVAAAMSELAWTPDVAAVVCERLAREAVAYPEQHTGHPLAGDAAQPGTGGRADVARAIPTAVPAKRGGMVSVRAVALVLGAVLVGFSLAAASSGVDSPDELRAQIASWLGQADEEPAPARSGAAVDVAVSPSAVAGALDEAEPAEPVSRSPVPVTASSALPELTIISARTLADGEVGARVGLEWVPAAGLGPVVESRLERSLGDDAWDVVATSAEAGPVELDIEPGREYELRLRAVDHAGAETVSPPVGVELVVRGPGSRQLQRASDDWIIRRGNSIKRRLIATSPDASLRTTFDGSSVALVAPAGPERGAIGVRLNDGPWMTADLRTWERTARTIVYSQDLAPGSHTLDVRAETDGVGIDAVIIVRTKEA